MSSTSRVVSRAALFVLIAVLFAHVPLNAQQIDLQRPLVLTHVTIIDATGAPLQADMTVVISGPRIARLGKSGKVGVEKNAQIVDGRGKYLIPGLWDMHAHLEMWGEKAGLLLYLANGITGVRDMGGDLEHLKTWRTRIETGALSGPRIVFAGPIVDGPTPGYPLRLTVRNESEARLAVDSLKRDGVDFIKVHAHLSRSSYLAIADEARKQGISFAGHIPLSVTAQEASEAGQKSIEHLNESFLLMDCSTPEPKQRRGGPHQYLDTYDPVKCEALFERFRRNGTWQDPTLVGLHALSYLDSADLNSGPRAKYLSKDVRDYWQSFMEMFLKRSKQEWDNSKRVFQKDLEIVGAMHRAGVPILAGTDAALPSLFAGFSLHDELVLLVEAGLTPMDALQAATRNPARFLGKLDSLGTVETGKIADLVLLDANPMQDIQNTRRINAVIFNGRLLDKSTLQQMLSDVEAAARVSGR